MVAPDDTSGNGANDPELAELRFDPETVTCEPSANSTVPGAWQTSAPRKKVADDAQAELGVRDTEKTEDRDVVVQVLTPAEERVEAETALSGDEWATLAYPEDFPDAPGSLAEGTYTVIWSASAGDDADEDSGTFISCDGFRVG